MKQITILAALLMTAANAVAQKNINKEMDALLNDKSITKVVTSNYDDSDRGTSITTYCHYAELHIPSKQSQKIKRLEEAFEDDAVNGYKSLYQTPQISAEKSNVVYGPNLEHSILFCTRPSHNYRLLFVHDKNNATKRYVYAMVWYKDAGGTRCLLYRIYGDNPAKVTKQPTVVKRTITTTRPDGSSTMTILDENSIRIIGSNNNSVTEEGNPAEYLGTFSMVNNTSPIHKFGNLRIAFLEAIKDPEQKSLQTGIVMNIVELCKNHGKKFSQNERNTCKISINEMQNIMKKTNPDTFLNGMLDEAYQHLGK